MFGLLLDGGISINVLSELIIQQLVLLQTDRQTDTAEVSERWQSATDTLMIRYSVLYCTVLSTVLRVVVTGCADPPLPRHATMRRDHNDVTVWCNNTSQSDHQQQQQPAPHQFQWKLTCDGSQWIGTQYNCSTGAAPHSRTTSLFV